MSLALAPLTALCWGLALCALGKTPLTRLQHLGAALALGPALVAALLTVSCICGVDVSAASWGLVVAGPVMLALAWRQLKALPDTIWVPTLLGATTLGALILLRWSSVPAVRGDGLSMSLLRALAMESDGGPWQWLRSNEAALLHPDYPLGVPALLAFGRALGGASDAAALTPLLCVLPGAALFVVATLARTGRVAAWSGAFLFASLPILRTYASSGQPDTLLAALLGVVLLASAQGYALLAATGLLLLPFVKHDGLVQLVLLGALLAWPLSKPQRFRFLGLALFAALLWPATLWLRDIPFVASEQLGTALPVSLVGLATHWSQVTFSADNGLALVPGLMLLAAAVCWRDRNARRPALACAALFVVLPLLLFVRGTSSEVALHGDLLHRLVLQGAPAAIGFISLALALVLRQHRAA